MNDVLLKKARIFAEAFIKARGYKKKEVRAFVKWDDNKTNDGWEVIFTINKKPEEV